MHDFRRQARLQAFYGEKTRAKTALTFVRIFASITDVNGVNANSVYADEMYSANTRNSNGPKETNERKQLWRNGGGEVVNKKLVSPRELIRNIGQCNEQKS